jgi:hypothetical protein
MLLILFETVEDALATKGRAMSEATLDEMEQEWARVKAMENTKERATEDRES